MPLAVAKQSPCFALILQKLMFMCKFLTWKQILLFQLCLFYFKSLIFFLLFYIFWLWELPIALSLYFLHLLLLSICNNLSFKWFLLAFASILCISLLLLVSLTRFLILGKSPIKHCSSGFLVLLSSHTWLSAILKDFEFPVGSLITPKGFFPSL